MEENSLKKSFDIVLLDGEYMELYTRTPDEEPDLNRKVKKGMLKKIGLSDEEIEQVVDSVELQFEQGGVDGEFDDTPYTPCRLVKKVSIDPPQPPQPPSSIDDEPEEPPKGVSQLMLEQFYGDSRKERERNAAFSRYKSHIGKKNIEVFDEETGDKKTIEVYGVLDYDGKSKDTRDLRITGFETRLEKLSRAIQGDFSLYETQLSKMTCYARQEMLDAYEALRETDPKLAEEIKHEVESQLEEMSSDENKHKMIQALIDKDTEFIETNNYSYNSRQHVQEHLKTLGKHGERSIKHAVTKEHSKLQKIGLHTLNGMITLRNYIKAPVHKAIGTFVAAPLHRLLFKAGKTSHKGPVCVDGFEITPIEDMLATSQKRSVGTFKNKPTHRYQARKSYFIQQEREKLVSESKEKEKLVSESKESHTKFEKMLTTMKNTASNIFRLAIIPRIKAIVNYKEGNRAVLNAGAYDEIELSLKRRLDVASQSVRLDGAKRRIELYEKEIKDLQLLLRHAKSPEQKIMLEQTIEARKKGRLREEIKRNEIERTEIDDVPVDAIGLSDHDKAVKSDMSKSVTGVKFAGRIVGGMLIGRYLYDEIQGKDQIIEEEIFHPATKEPDQIIREAGMGEEEIMELSFDRLDSGVTRTLMHDTYNDNASSIDTVAEELRGIAFEYNGQKFSGADINAMSINPDYAGCVIDQPLNGSTLIPSVIKEVLEDSTGKSFTDSEIAKMILSGEITEVQRCLSKFSEGIPSGWEAPSDAIKKLIDSGTHEIIIKGKEIPAYIETVYKVVEGDVERVINTPAAVALAALGEGQLADLNELLRYTESEPGKIRMLVEYEKSRIEREKAKDPKSEPDIKEVPKQIQTKSFQRNTKPKARKFSCKPNIPGFKGFHGTKRHDLGKHGELGKAGFNENKILGFVTNPLELDEFSERSDTTKKPSTDDFEI